MCSPKTKLFSHFYVYFNVDVFLFIVVGLVCWLVFTNRIYCATGYCFYHLFSVSITIFHITYSKCVHITSIKCRFTANLQFSGYCTQVTKFISAVIYLTENISTKEFRARRILNQIKKKMKKKQRGKAKREIG